jgi:hypothetical protein
LGGLPAWRRALTKAARRVLDRAAVSAAI